MIRNQVKIFDIEGNAYSIQEINARIPNRKYKKRKRYTFTKPYLPTITPFQRLLKQLPGSVLHIIWRYVNMKEYNGLYSLHPDPPVTYRPLVEQRIERKHIWYPTSECAICKMNMHTKRTRKCQLCNERVCSHCWEMVSKSLYEKFKCFFWFRKSKEYVYCTECKEHLMVSCSNDVDRVMDCRRIHHKWGEDVFKYWNSSSTKPSIHNEVDDMMKGVYGSYYFEDKMRLQLHISRSSQVRAFPEWKRYRIEEYKKYIDGELFTIRYKFYL